MRDVLSWYYQPWQTFTGKAATGPRAVWEIAQNRDWRGLPIVNPEDNAAQWLKDYGKYVEETFGPITVRQFLKGEKKGSNIGTLERALGIRPAPGYLQDPRGSREAAHRRNVLEQRRKQAIEKRARAFYGG